jgi:MFS family permease
MRLRSHLTLALCVILHAFTHAYAVILVPLYLMMKSDMHLPGVKAAALIVTFYGVVYNAGSYFAGTLADRFDRRVLLGIGLIGNASAIAMMGLSNDYALILCLAVAAGLFGAIFHPAANALVCALYPANPGMAIGLLGVGSGLGFFAGPQFAGWRAQATGNWQRPCLELGIAGLVFGLIFLALANEAGPRSTTKSPRLGRVLWRRLLALSAVLGWRDFSAIAVVSLASIYLQKACGKTVGQAGFIVGSMMLLGIFSNPLATYLTGGRRRLPALCAVCLAAGAVLATTPWWPIALPLIPLCAYQTLQLASYAISDAATLERVAPAIRGRVVGVYLSCAGTLGALSPVCMGYWIDKLGPRAAHPSGFIGPFLAVAAAMAFASLSPLVIRRLGQPTGEQPISPAEEISPATMEGAV